MKIYKVFKGESEILTETKTDFLNRTEGSGWIANGKAIETLSTYGSLETPFAFYFTNEQLAQLFINQIK